MFALDPGRDRWGEETPRSFPDVQNGVLLPDFRADAVNGV
jgi:hypothetical protein